LKTATDTGPTFALKQLISDSEVEFRQEEEALRRIHRLEHEHLIRVVSSFRRGHDYFFLFPWAEKGNLWQVWERRSNEKREIDLIKWVLEQIKGIASGVRILHFLPDNPVSEENCRHGDLRPENILLFPSSSNDQFGTLRITDVGLAKIHELRTENRVRGTTTRGGDQQYAPPKTGDKRSRKYDIWSLGCIYLEFVVWVLGGMDEVHRFEKARGTAHLEYYSTKSSKGAEILPAVTRWIKDIRNDARCEGKNAFRDLIELVEGHLLVIDEEKRYDANELDAALAQILDDVHKSDGYLLNKSSRGGFVPSEIQHRKFLEPEIMASLAKSISRLTISQVVQMIIMAVDRV
jgi:serine/threonine protein kinase